MSPYCFTGGFFLLPFLWVVNSIWFFKEAFFKASYEEQKQIKTCKFHLYGTLKPVLSGHSKIDKIKILTTNGSLMKVESIAECSLGAFCNTFDLHLAMIGLKNQFWSSS